MPAAPSSPDSVAPRRPSAWWLLPLLLVLAATLYQFVVGPTHTLPVGTVAQLGPTPVPVAYVPVGPDSLVLQANGYLLSQTRDVGGPELWPAAAALWVALLGLSLSLWLAAVSTLPRLAFVAGTAAAIFLLMSLNPDALEALGGRHYELVTVLVVLAGAAYLLHAFLEGVRLGPRVLIFVALVAGLGALLYLGSPYPAAYVSLHLAGYGTVAGAAALGLLALWVGGELVFGLLWLNTQGPTPQSRFGLLPFVAASALLLGSLVLYYWNGGRLMLFPGGIHLDPYLLLLLAALVGWFSMPLRRPTYAGWVPAKAAPLLYLALLTLAMASAGYAAATHNEPVLAAGRQLVALALLCVGVPFLLYVLMNFAPLIRQRLRVYRVVYEPRRLPYYAVYLLALGGIVAVLVRNNFDLLDQARAGMYVQLGDLTRFQSEGQPENTYLPLLAERYYAEADQLDPRNARAALGRAALYQQLSQRQNEINILRTTLLREPHEKVLLRLAARYDQSSDFFDRQQVLRQGLRAYPASRWLNAEMAQLYARSSLTDSVVYYYQRATAADADDAVAHTNWLAFLLKQNQLNAAAQSVAEHPFPQWPAWQSNQLLFQLLQKPAQTAAAAQATPQPLTDSVLTVAQFAHLYHIGLARAARRDTTLLPLLTGLRRQSANDPFADQLHFLQGLTRLRGGEPARGFDQLETLATGTGAGYYQQLLGLYLLERGLYPSAASRLALATAAGNPAAALPRAWAFAFGSRPDSARTLALRVAALPTEARSAQQLLNALPQLPAARPPAYQPFAAQFARAATLDKRAAESQYRRLVAADPFAETGIIQAADFFAGQSQYLAAYEALRRALQYNPESVALLQRFALAAADAGLTDYSGQTLEKLRTLLPSEEYATFQSQLSKRRAIHQAAAAPWD
ncbi:hypothetical protein [Hymenobacter sp. B81]|uniref:hypothetical protein n=1 Tax=Hymenobacter sp. B81 TaxID=3344878 RepID=UPI0037DD6DDA